MFRNKLVISIGVSLLGFYSLSAQSSIRPNVLFIAIDDQNDWLGCLGAHPHARTPHLDQIAQRGTLFTNAHCQAPICNPSRASVLTGKRPSTLGLYTLEPGHHQIRAWASLPTLPGHFKAHGYRTLTCGKIYHNSPRVPEYGFWPVAPRMVGLEKADKNQKKPKNNQASERQAEAPISLWEAPPPAPAKSSKPFAQQLVSDFGWFSFEGFSYYRDPEFTWIGPKGSVGITPPQKLIGPTPMGNNGWMDWGAFPHRDEDKGDAVITDWTIEQLRTRLKDQPFFHAVGYFLPHVPIYVPPAWLDAVPDDDRLLPLVKEDDRADVPRFSWFLHWSTPEPRLPWLKAKNQWRNLVRAYLAGTHFVDHQIGRLLRTLDEEGLCENTIIVVWGDHGWHLGEKGITGKNTLWERSTRVPLIFAGPGVTPQQRVTSPAELLDIFPTLIDLCGLPPASGLEGQSLRPQLEKATTPRAQPAITTANPHNHSVRTERYRYIRYADGSEEFYDLQTDPNEWTNLSSDPALAPLIAEHRRWLPTINEPHSPGSSTRMLEYDPVAHTHRWEGTLFDPNDPVPE